MAGQITLYIDSDFTQPLSTGTWTNSLELGNISIPDEGSQVQEPVPCFGKNTGTTTMQAVSISAVVGTSVEDGAEIVNDLQIAPDYQGSPGNFGNDSQAMQIVPGNLSPVKMAPTSNTTNPALTNPTNAPNLSIGSTGTNLVSGVYTVGYSFANATGETSLSPTQTITIASGNSILVGTIALPSGANQVNYYISYKAGVSILYFAESGDGTPKTLIKPQGTFAFWVRQNVKSTDTPGRKQAQLLVDATDIG